MVRSQNQARPLHILHVVPYFYPAWAYGGIPRLAWGLSRTLIRQGARVTVLTTDAFDVTARLPEGCAPRMLEGVRVITLRNLSNTLAYRHQGFLPRGLWSALENLDADPPDVIHLHGHWHLLNRVAVSWAQRRGIPLVMTPHGTLPPIEQKILLKRLLDPLLGRPVLKAVSAFVAVTRAEVAQLRAAGVESSRIALIPNGLDLGEFEPLPERGRFRAREGLSGPVVLYLGRLSPRKGLEPLLDALLHPSLAGVTLVVAGTDFGIEDALRRRAERLGLKTRVRFVGLLVGTARLEALADADVLAYPSSLEIFGLVPFEGLMAGAPAVVGDDCGCGELVQTARAGLLVPIAQPEALALALARLLENPGLRAELVARGRRFIREHLSWEDITARTLQVYRRLVATEEPVDASQDGPPVVSADG